MILVDEPGPDREGGKRWTSHRNVVRQLSLQVANRLRVNCCSRRVFGVETVSSDLGRPPIGKEPRQLIAIRIDPSVLESFRKEARRRRVGYQTLINEVLAEHIRKDVA